MLMQVPQVEHESVARFSLRQRELLSRFSQQVNQALENQRDIMVTKVTTEVWRRHEQVHDLRAELRLHALHSEDVMQQQSPEYAGIHKHLTGLVQETREMSEEPRAPQSAAGPEIDRLPTENQNDVTITREQHLMLHHEGIGHNPESLESRTTEDQHIVRELRSEVWQMRASAVAPNLTRDLGAMIGSQKYERQSLPRDLQTTHDSMNSGMQSTSIRFKVSVLMKVLMHRHHPSSELRNQQSDIYHKLGGEPRAVPTKRAYNADSSFRIGCSSEYSTSEHLENSSGRSQYNNYDDFFTN